MRGNRNALIHKFTNSQNHHAAGVVNTEAECEHANIWRSRPFSLPLQASRYLERGHQR